MITKLPIKGAENIYLQVKHGLPLKEEANEDALKSALLFVFALLGLKQDSWPTELEKPVLHNSIIEKFGDITAEEIRIAYKMAVNGELFEDSKQINLKLYGDVYSFDHFARVLRAYRLQKRNEIKTLIANELQNKEEAPSDERRAEIRRDYVENSIMKHLKRHANGNEDISFETLSCVEVYKEFWKAGLVEITKSEQDEMYRKHKQILLKKFQEKVSEPARSEQESAIKNLMKEALNGKNSYLDSQVKEACSQEAIKKSIEIHSLEIVQQKLLNN